MNPLCAGLWPLTWPHGGVCLEAESEGAAKDMLDQHSIDMALYRPQFDPSPELEGLSLVKYCTTKGVPSVVLTGHAERPVYHKAYSMGARHFFMKGDFSGEGGVHPFVTFIKDSAPMFSRIFFEGCFVTKDKISRERSISQGASF